MSHSEKRLLYFLLILLILGGGAIVVLNFNKKIKQLQLRESLLNTQLQELQTIEGDLEKLDAFQTWIDRTTANPVDDEEVDSMLLERISGGVLDVTVTNVSLKERAPYIGNLVSSSITCSVRGEPGAVLKYISSLRDYEKLITLSSLKITRIGEEDEIQAQLSLRQVYAPTGEGAGG